MLDEARILLSQIVREIKKAPMEKGKMFIAVDEYNYALLQVLKMRNMIDFTYHGTEDTLKGKMYIASIPFRIENGLIYIKTKDNEIVYRR